MAGAIARVTPFVRADDALAAAEWYAPMGFELFGVYQPDPHEPRFVTLRAGDHWLFVSEHQGDAAPNTLVYVQLADTAAVDAVARAYGAEACTWPWDMYEVHLTDPAGNRVRVGCPA